MVPDAAARDAFDVMRHTPAMARPSRSRPTTPAGPDASSPSSDDGPAGQPAATDETEATAATPTALGRLTTAAEPIVDSVVGTVVGTVGSVSHAMTAAVGGLRDRPGMRVRRVRRMGRIPLPSLPELFPESAMTRRVDIGMRTIEVDDIAGTAVGGGDQRGGDFLPLKPFRGQNWAGRWQRLRRAADKLAALPPIDVVKYADKYWVLDGHNRVALALYTGQRDIDASVVELVPRGGHRTEPFGSLAVEVEAARPMRARAAADDPPP